MGLFPRNIIFFHLAIMLHSETFQLKCYLGKFGQFPALVLLHLTSDGMDKARRTEKQHSIAALCKLLVPQVPRTTGSTFRPLNLSF